MNVLGIETSCDETAAAVVRDGHEALSNVVFAQAKLHAPYGGVVPEIASRSHVEVLPGIIAEAVRLSGLTWESIDAVAATYGPGLAGSLLVGLSAGKALAMKLDRPFFAVNHLEAHIYSVFLGKNAPDVRKVCPFVALIVSGGHTCLVRVEELGRYILMGQTVDDAAGEAFDKGANLLGLEYPGGPAVARASFGGNPDRIKFPRGRQARDKWAFEDLDADLCFSFSGLKTALRYYLHGHPIRGIGVDMSLGRDDEGDGTCGPADIAASYQEAIVDALVDRCRKAARHETCLAAVGGVSVNSRLREKLALLADGLGLKLLLPAPCYCADNAAMVAGLAGVGQGICGEPAMEIDASPSLRIGAPLGCRASAC